MLDILYTQKKGTVTVPFWAKITISRANKKAISARISNRALVKVVFLMKTVERLSWSAS